MKHTKLEQIKFMKIVSRKGILESIPEFFQIIIALAIAIVMITITFYFFSLQTRGNKIELSGNVNQISSSVANYIQNCWKDHRGGLDTQSAICYIITIKISVPVTSETGADTITESNITNFLNCNNIPNSDCFPDDCSKCISTKYPEDQQDKIKWDFDSSTTYMQISYQGADRVIEVSNLYPGV